MRAWVGPPCLISLRLSIYISDVAILLHLSLQEPTLQVTGSRVSIFMHTWCQNKGAWCLPYSYFVACASTDFLVARRTPEKFSFNILIGSPHPPWLPRWDPLQVILLDIWVTRLHLQPQQIHSSTKTENEKNTNINKITFLAALADATPHFPKIYMLKVSAKVYIKKFASQY